MFTPTGKSLVELFMKLGYTPHQAEHLYRALFTHYWYDYGIRDVVHVNSLINFWQKSYLAPAWQRAAEKPPPLFPPAVVYVVVVVAIASVVLVLVAPDWTEPYKWAPPCNLYLGVYEEQLWWVTLVSVSPTQRPYYKALAYEGSVINAHTYEYIAPPVVTDRFHFWGTLDWRCWKIPWFRVYRTQYADTIFIGFLQRVSGNLFRLREPFVDHWAPLGPVVIPEDAWCKIFSPCSE